MTTTVKQLLERKGSEVFSVRADQTVYEALEQMAEKNVGALLVVDGQGNPVGILSERDYARKVILLDKSSRETPVSEVMTSELVSARPEQTVHECMEMATHQRIRHFPVLDADGRLLGMLSIGDLVKALLDEQASTIEQLESYIASG